VVVLVVVVIVVDYLLHRHHRKFAVGFHHSHLCYHHIVVLLPIELVLLLPHNAGRGFSWSICEGNGGQPTNFPNSTSTPCNSTTMVVTRKYSFWSDSTSTPTNSMRKLVVLQHNTIVL
jgi:hypothetical protein